MGTVLGLTVGFVVVIVLLLVRGSDSAALRTEWEDEFQVKGQPPYPGDSIARKELAVFKQWEKLYPGVLYPGYRQAMRDINLAENTAKGGTAQCRPS